MKKKKKISQVYLLWSWQQVLFVHLPLSELKPSLVLSPFISILKNYIEDSYYNSLLFHLTILFTVFLVLIGHKNKNAIMCLLTTSWLNREFGWNYLLLMLMKSIMKFSLLFVFSTKNLNLEIVLLIFFQINFLFILILWTLKSIWKTWIKSCLKRLLISPLL